jgi:hypothetical protein
MTVALLRPCARFFVDQNNAAMEPEPNLQSELCFGTVQFDAPNRLVGFLKQYPKWTKTDSSVCAATTRRR